MYLHFIMNKKRKTSPIASYPISILSLLNALDSGPSPEWENDSTDLVNLIFQAGQFHFLLVPIVINVSRNQTCILFTG